MFNKLTSFEKLDQKGQEHQNFLKELEAIALDAIHYCDSKKVKAVIEAGLDANGTRHSKNGLLYCALSFDKIKSNSLIDAKHREEYVSNAITIVNDLIAAGASPQGVSRKVNSPLAIASISLWGEEFIENLLDRGLKFHAKHIRDAEASGEILCNALASGNHALRDKLFDAGADISKAMIKFSMFSPKTFASSEQYFESAVWLLDRGADPKNAPLSHAIEHCNRPFLQKLLEKNPSSLDNETDMPWVNWAAMKKERLEGMKFLLDLGLSPHVRDRDNCSALDYAIAFNNPGAIDELVRRGVNANGPGDGAIPPILLANLKMHTRIDDKQSLLEAKLLVDQLHKLGANPLDLTITMDQFKDALKSEGRFRGQENSKLCLQAIKQGLLSKLSPDAQNEFALDYLSKPTVRHFYQNEVLKALPDFNPKKIEKITGESLIGLAMQSRPSPAEIEFCMAAGADVNAKFQGTSLVQFALDSGKEYVIMDLFHHGASKDDIPADSPLHSNKKWMKAINEIIRARDAMAEISTMENAAQKAKSAVESAMRRMA